MSSRPRHAGHGAEAEPRPYGADGGRVDGQDTERRDGEHGARREPTLAPPRHRGQDEEPGRSGGGSRKPEQPGIAQRRTGADAARRQRRHAGQPSGQLNPPGQEPDVQAGNGEQMREAGADELFPSGRRHRTSARDHEGRGHSRAASHETVEPALDAPAHRPAPRAVAIEDPGVPHAKSVAPGADDDHARAAGRLCEGVPAKPNPPAAACADHDGGCLLAAPLNRVEQNDVRRPRASRPLRGARGARPPLDPPPGDPSDASQERERGRRWPTTDEQQATGYRD